MKTEYKLYKKSSSQIINTLSQKEKDILENYKKHLSMTSSKNKINQNITIRLQLKDILEKDITKIKRLDLETFWGLIKMSKYEYNYKVMIKRAVKRFVKWYYKDLSLIENLEVGDFKPNRDKINKSVLLKPEELQSMLHKATNLRDKALLILLYESASRPQELKDLKWKDIDWDSEEVHLDSSKTERARDVPIKESILHLKRWKQEWLYPNVQEEDYIFPSRWREEKLSTEQINNIVKKISHLSGISRNITSYTFRHSRLTEIYKLGVKGLEHNKFAGHKEGSRQQTTYSHIDNEDMREEVLKKVYHKTEISKEKKHKLELEIELLRKAQEKTAELIYQLANKKKLSIQEINSILQK